MDIELNHDSEILLSQKGFIGRLKEAGISEIVSEKRVRASTDVLKRFYRRHLGNLIWVMQTRFDVGYMVTEYDTTAPYVLSDVAEISAAVKMINRAVSVLETQEVILTYCKLFPTAQIADSSLIRRIRILSSQMQDLPL